MSIYTIIVVLIYLLITAFLGYLGFKRTKSSQDYLVAGRQVHPLIMAISYGATFISTAAIVGFGGAAGRDGMGMLWLTFLNIFAGIFIAFVFFGKRTRKMGHSLDAHTFPELIGKRFDSKFIQFFAGLIIVFIMPIYAASVIKGGANFVETQFKIPFEVSLLLFVVIVAFYVLMGGLKGVMYTDAFQGAIMFCGMVFLLIFVYTKLGGISSAHQQLTDLFNNPDVQNQLKDPTLLGATSKVNQLQKGFLGWTSMPKFNSGLWWGMLTSLVGGVGIGVLAQPQLLVRFMTVKSNRELNRAVLSGGIFILMMTGVAFTIGALSNVIFFNDSGKIALAAAGATDKIIPTFIKNYVPSWFSVVFLLTLLAAAMSTLSSLFHTMGTAIGRDIYEKSLNKKGNSIFITKFGMLVAIILSTVLAWLSKYLPASNAIIAIGTTAFFVVTAAAFLPLVIGGLYFKKLPKLAAIWGMVSGFSAAALWMLFIEKSFSSSFQICKFISGKDSLVSGTSLEWLGNKGGIIIALPLSIIVTIVLGLILKQDMDKKHIDKCFEGI